MPNAAHHTFRIESGIRPAILPNWYALTFPLWHLRIQSGIRLASLSTDISLQPLYGIILLDIIYAYTFIRIAGNDTTIMYP